MKLVKVGIGSRIDLEVILGEICYSSLGKILDGTASNLGYNTLCDIIFFHQILLDFL